MTEGCNKDKGQVTVVRGNQTKTEIDRSGLILVNKLIPMRSPHKRIQLKQRPRCDVTNEKYSRYQLMSDSRREKPKDKGKIISKG